jgi:hypothetical protein
VDLARIAEKVLELIASHGEEQSDDLSQVEAEVQTTVQRVGARAIEVHWEPRRLGYEGPSRLGLLPKN